MSYGGGYCKGNAKITLTQCKNCGYVFNASFDLEQINNEYSSQTYISRKIVSKEMSENIQSIKNKILKYLDKNSHCLEIAPGSGDMVLALIDEVESFTTIDPSLVSLELKDAKNLKHIQGFFDYEFVKNKLEHEINFVLFRHLLEHINTPYDFLNDVIKLLANEGIIYIEVPNLDEFIERNRFYEVFNDHCGYYQKNVLINVLNDLGCELIDEIFLYEKQHMGLFFRKNNFKTDKKLEFKHYDLNIAKNFNQAIKSLNLKFQNYQNIALYGAGAHGNSLLNFLSQNCLLKIKKCFDLDIRKQGQYLQNSNIKISKPQAQEFKSLDLILLAVPLYEQEVINFLREKGYKGDFIKSKNMKIL